MTETTYPTPDLELTQSPPVASSSNASPSTADLAQLKSSATERLTAERDKLTSTLRSFTDELREMQTSSSTSGPATSLMGQAADRTDQILSYVESREPEQLFNDARDYASRHPGLFLAGAAVVGGVLGRITRTAAAAALQSDATSGSANAQVRMAPDRAGEGAPATERASFV